MFLIDCNLIEDLCIDKTHKHANSRLLTSAFNNGGGVEVIFERFRFV